MRLSDIKELPWKICWQLIPEKMYMTRHGIDTERFYQLKKKYSELGDEIKGVKYLRFNTRFKGRLNYAYQLGLGDSKEKKNILDIGTGVGYFPYICNRFGHNAMAFDLGDYELFNDMIEMLGVNRPAYSITPFEPIPDQGRRFDLVTAFLICFNNHNKPGLWGVPEWEFFFTDLVKNHMSERGEVFLHFNYEMDTNLPFTEELKRYFIEHGALIDLNEVHFRSMRSFR
jgi:cyclopropane fatty-acyl-phospholipid synthase-like methyltransferase